MLAILLFPLITIITGNAYYFGPKERKHIFYYLHFIDIEAKQKKV